LHSFSVDNVLNLVCDPVFIGYTDINSFDMSSKAVEKTDSREAVGVIAMKNNVPTIVEYSELGEDLSKQKDKNGKLMYRLGNICNNVFKVSFLSKIVRENLPDLQ